MLKVENLTKTYKGGSKPALDKLSLHVEKNEFTALLGENGAGKSTFINVLAGIVVKDGGSVRIGEYDLDREELATKKLVGIVPQELSFDYVLTVEETLHIQSGYFGIRKNHEWIDYLLSSLQLTEKRKTNSRQLSGGMKRRLLIAKALVHRPPFLILDEPTAGVDVELRLSLFAFLKKLRAEGTTILLTTHNMEEVEGLCERVIILHEGQVALDRQMSDLNLGPSNRLVDLYLKTIRGTQKEEMIV